MPLSKVLTDFWSAISKLDIVEAWLVTSPLRGRGIVNANRFFGEKKFSKQILTLFNIMLSFTHTCLKTFMPLFLDIVRYEVITFNTFPNILTKNQSAIFLCSFLTIDLVCNNLNQWFPTLFYSRTKQKKAKKKTHVSTNEL